MLYVHLYIHAGQVAVEDGGGLDQRFSQRHDGKFDGESPGFGNAALDHIGQLAEVRITRRQFRPGVANADDGFAAKLLIGMPWSFIQARQVNPSLPVFSNQF